MKHLIMHELRLLLREPKFLIPFFLPILFIFAGQFAVRKMPFQDELAEHFILVIGLFISTMSVTLLADSFAGEKERNTLDLLVSFPISISNIFISKLLVAYPVPLFVSLIIQYIYGSSSGLSADWIVNNMILNISVSLLVSVIALIISLNTNSVKAANQLSMLVVLLFLITAPLYQVLVPAGEIFICLCLVLSVTTSFLLGKLAFRSFQKNMNKSF